MTALGITTLQLWLGDFKLLHSFIICDRLPDTEIICGIDVQKKVTLSYAWDQEKNCYVQKQGRFFTYTRNCEQKANVAIVKSTLKIPPRHNGIVPMKIKRHTIKGHMAYFISDQDSKKKGKDPNIHIINGIHNIRGRTHVNVFISNHTNKHITFNKGEHVGHVELPVEDMEQIPENSGSLTAHSITTKMMAKKVEPDTLKPPHHKLRKNIETKLGKFKGIPVSVHTE